MVRSRSLSLAVAATFAICLAQECTAEAQPIDSAHSKIIVHVSKSGVFSAFGDNHEVEAPVAEGTVDEVTRRVTFAVDARRMQVLDPHFSPGKRQEVQERMLGPDVLDVTNFPRITFESTTLEQTGPGQFIVHGLLSLHGMTREIAVNVQSTGGHYTGACRIKQRDFGITPVTIAGGTVRVKDELRIEFDIRTAAGASASPAR